MAANGGGGGGVLTVSIRRSAETITIPDIERTHNARMLLRKQKNQEIKGYERPVSDDWDIVQLARFPHESRKRTHIPDDG